MRTHCSFNPVCLAAAIVLLSFFCGAAQAPTAVWNRKTSGSENKEENTQQGSTVPCCFNHPENK